LIASMVVISALALFLAARKKADRSPSSATASKSCLESSDDVFVLEQPASATIKSNVRAVECGFIKNFAP
jgi:hypothetical protein